MRRVKEIKEELKRQREEHTKRKLRPTGYSTAGMLTLVATIGILEWVLGDKEKIWVSK